MTRYAKTMSQAIEEMQELQLERMGYSPKEIKMAIGIASDPRYAKGNMTGAVNAIEKMKKGLSKHPQVAAVLKRQNENLNCGCGKTPCETYGEDSLDEKYDLYHKDFSSAMQHAYDYAQKKLGITVDKSEIDRKVATGPKKPSEGKTNKYRLKGKGGNLQIQVYNKGGSKPFELNMYKEEFESDLDENKVEVGLDEAKFQVNYSKGGKLFSKTVNAKNEDDAEDKAIKQFKIEDDDIRSVVKEASARADAMRAMGRGRKVDPADVDEPKASDTDKKSAMKNMIMQMRQSLDSKGTKPIEFADGKSQKVDPKILTLLTRAHDKIQKPRDKEKFVTMISKSYRDMLKVSTMVGKQLRMGESIELDEMAYKPGSFKDTRPQEKTAKAFDKYIKTGGLDQEDFEKARKLYVQTSDVSSRKKLRNFIQDLDTAPMETVMDIIGRNDPDTFEKMYPDAKSGEFLSKISFRHRKIKNEEVELDEMDMKYVLINMQGKVQGYASDKKDALDIARRTKSTMHPIKKKISDKTLEKMNALAKTPKELKDLGIIEGVEMNELKMNDPKLNKIFDKLKPKSTVQIKKSSSIRKDQDFSTYLVMNKNTLKNGTEKITLKNRANPTGVKSFLYRKDGKVTFAIGDMGASIDDIKESIDEAISKDDKETILNVIKGLKGAVQAHSGQAKELEKVIKNNIGEEKQQSIDEMKMNSKQIAMLKKTFEPLRGKKISPSAGDKLIKIMDKIDKDKQTLIDLMKADIPFVSQLAVTRLISKHNMKGDEINKLKELFNLDEALKGFKVEFGKGDTSGMAVYKDKKDAEAFAKRQPKPVKITQITVKNANMFDDPNPTRKEDKENEMTEKLTDGNLSLKDTVIEMWKEAVSPAQQAAIAISKKEKGEKPKKEKDEGNAFGAALEKARKNGDKTFVIGGKTYDVKTETNKNDKSDDGDGLDAVQPKAVKKKFKDRKDKDIDNDGDVDDSDKFLHKRRKAVSKAIASEEFSTVEYERYLETKKGSLRDSILKVWGEDTHSDDDEDAKKKDLTKSKKDGTKKMTDTGKEMTPVDMSPKMVKTKNERNRV